MCTVVGVSFSRVATTCHGFQAQSVPGMALAYSCLPQTGGTKSSVEGVILVDACVVHTISILYTRYIYAVVTVDLD